MLEVLYFSDKNVRQKLFERVGGAKGLMLVTATRQGKFMAPAGDREPFAGLERSLGDVLTLVVVADEGTVEGMWRDPVGDLADALFPEDRNKAYSASSGYLLLQGGEVKTVVQKHGSARDDAWFIHEALAQMDRRIPAPDPSQRPGPRRRRSAPPGRPEDVGQDEERTPPPRRKPLSADPWELLGIAPGSPLLEAKKAFRALIAQYHPDKVAHLAPEFRELAEERTRQILAAWEQIEAQST